MFIGYLYLHYIIYFISYKDNGVCNKHNVMDIRQLHAINLGFMLTKDEMTLDYIPNEDVTLPHLPNKYVLIHPVQNWNSRTWPAKNWQMLMIIAFVIS